MRSGQIDHLSLRRLSVDTIDLNDSHVVTFDPEVLTGKGADIGHSEEVGLARLDGNGEILRVVHQCRVRYWLGARGILEADEVVHESGKLIMIPVGDGDADLFVVLSGIRILGIVDEELSSEAIWVLCSAVRVVPICARLFNLQDVSLKSEPHDDKSDIR